MTMHFFQNKWKIEFSFQCNILEGHEKVIFRISTRVGYRKSRFDINKYLGKKGRQINFK